jgi:predicted helicase
MYARFFRWASNRLADNGILTFVTNSSFLEARTFDGFRKVVASEFNEIYIVDLGGDVRKNSKLSGTKNNVFGIQTGVAISFLVKRQGATFGRCKIYYARRPEMELAIDKLAFLRTVKFKEIDFDRIMPDKNHNWLNIADNDFDELLPLVNKETKQAKSQKEERAVFKLFSLGVVTARDEWVYDYSVKFLKQKVKYLINIYNQEVKKHQTASQSELGELVDYSIKWTRAVKNDLLKGQRYGYKVQYIRDSFYRPFVKKSLYFSSDLNEMQYQLNYVFVESMDNQLICLDVGNKSSNVLVANVIPDYHYNGDTNCLPLYRYDKDGNRTNNITDWGLNQFRTHYQNDSITKEDIFHYTYAVLHHPAYREKYALNLKREFPRLPFYEDFPQWVTWGKQLMDLHLNYETVKKYALKRIDKKLASNKANKPKLKADKEAGNIQLDDITTLQGIPFDAWEYKLGNRSALEWILDQYKEKKPRDQTIAEKFNTYRFADYKESVIELLQRVCTVSVETMAIIGKMP